MDNGFGTVFSVPCLYCNSLTLKRYSVDLFLCEASSGSVVTVSSANCSRDSFDREIEKYNPYGYILDSRTQFGNIDAMFVAVDELSMEFLSYVDSVDVVEDVDQSLLHHILYLDADFLFWDRLRTLVDVNSRAGHNLAFPLFQALCFAKLNWYDGKLYLRANTMSRRVGYIVNFCDESKARVMLARAAICGYNPIKANLEIINRM